MSYQINFRFKCVLVDEHDEWHLRRKPRGESLLHTQKTPGKYWMESGWQWMCGWAQAVGQKEVNWDFRKVCNTESEERNRKN